jgi:hypothetical protein
LSDTIPITAGTGTTVSTDERTIAATAQHVQRVAPHGAPLFAAAQVTVTNSSTTIAAARDTRHSVTIVNYQTVAVYIDDAAATTAAFRLDPGASITIFTGAVVNGITSAAYTASGDAKVHVLEAYD